MLLWPHDACVPTKGVASAMCTCRGVLLATAHVRGGGEHGRQWHMAGTVHRKWAALYDYAAALNYLVDSGVSAPGKMACDGFSAGALLQPVYLQSWRIRSQNHTTIAMARAFNASSSGICCPSGKSYSSYTVLAFQALHP